MKVQFKRRTGAKVQAGFPGVPHDIIVDGVHVGEIEPQAFYSWRVQVPGHMLPVVSFALAKKEARRLVELVDPEDLRGEE